MQEREAPGDRAHLGVEGAELARKDLALGRAGLFQGRRLRLPHDADLVAGVHQAPNVHKEALHGDAGGAKVVVALGAVNVEHLVRNFSVVAEELKLAGSGSGGSCGQKARGRERDAGGRGLS